MLLYMLIFWPEVQGPDLSAKPNSQFLGLQKGISLNSHNGTDNGTWNNRHLENNGNGKGWFSHVLESGIVSSSSCIKIPYVGSV